MITFDAPLSLHESLRLKAKGGDVEELGNGFPFSTLSGIAVDGYSERAARGFFIALYLKERLGVRADGSNDG
jgi:hypothetical protein